MGWKAGQGIARTGLRQPRSRRKAVPDVGNTTGGEAFGPAPFWKSAGPGRPARRYSTLQPAFSRMSASGLPVSSSMKSGWSTLLANFPSLFSGSTSQ